MTEEQYKELNDYLNEYIKNLNMDNNFFIDNLLLFGRYSSGFVKMMDNFKVKKIAKPKNLTFQDVILLAREIIETINKDYLKEFDQLIENGFLDFNYNEDCLYPSDKGSWCSYESGHAIINIERKFNYSDVTTLVHEFMHYTNSKSKKILNRYLLTEFISIFFERYAEKYLKEKYNVKNEELDFVFRVLDTKHISKKIDDYILVLLAFSKFGPIDSETYRLLNENFCRISKEEFDIECQNFIKKIKTIKDNFKKEVFLEKNYYEETKYINNKMEISRLYRYQLGLALSVYCEKNNKFDNVIKLNEGFSRYRELNIIDYLQVFDIDINTFDLKEFFDTLEKEIEGYARRK